MKLIRKIDELISDNAVKILSTNSFVNVKNYTKILDFDSNNIDIKLKDYDILIKGKDLVINKMLDNELLIKGKIESIIYR